MKRTIQTDNAPQAIGPYSQAIEIDGTLYVSGQVPINPKEGKVVEGGIEEQTDQVMKNVGAILKAAGYSYKDVIKSTCLLKNMDNFKAMNEVYGKYFPENPPARAAYQIGKLPLDVMVEVECIAQKG